jgi:hypothetical protein
MPDLLPAFCSLYRPGQGAIACSNSKPSSCSKDVLFFCRAKQEIFHLKWGDKIPNAENRNDFTSLGCAGRQNPAAGLAFLMIPTALTAALGVQFSSQN